LPSSYGVSVGVEVIVSVPAVDTKLVTVRSVVLMEGETSVAGAWVVMGVEVVVMVVMMVVGVSDNVTTVVESLVSVTGGRVFGGSVTVCVESFVTISVLGGAFPEGWPPSTGTTEYGAFLRAIWCSFRKSERGRA
jgi:hypothetical protein